VSRTNPVQCERLVEAQAFPYDCRDFAVVRLV
jgi:hypothetical protein